MDGSEHIESNALLDSIAKIVGDRGLIRDPADIEPYVVDQRKAYIGATPIVVSPASTEEVSKVVALCAKTGTAIVPQGGNTGLQGGAVPDGGSGATQAAPNCESTLRISATATRQSAVTSPAVPQVRWP